MKICRATDNFPAQSVFTPLFLTHFGFSKFQVVFSPPIIFEMLKREGIIVLNNISAFFYLFFFWGGGGARFQYSFGKPSAVFPKVRWSTGHIR